MFKIDFYSFSIAAISNAQLRVQRTNTRSRQFVKNIHHRLNKCTVRLKYYRIFILLHDAATGSWTVALIFSMAFARSSSFCCSQSGRCLFFMTYLRFLTACSPTTYQSSIFSMLSFLVQSVGVTVIMLCRNKCECWMHRQHVRLQKFLRYTFVYKMLFKF